MRDERGNIFSFDLFFSSTSENARTHKRSLDTRETKSRKLIQNRRERKKKILPRLLCLLLFKEQVKRSKNSYQKFRV